MNNESQLNEKFLLYSTYTALYLNDLACNCIKELEPYISTKDKETKKIYGALKKRSKGYLTFIKEVLKDNIYFLADFNVVIDDAIEEYVCRFRNSIFNAFSESGLEDSDFLSHLEYTRVLCEFSVKVIDRLCEDLSKMGIKSYRLKGYRLVEINNICTNLCKWCFRKVKYDIDFNKDERIVKTFKEMETHLIDYKLFEEAYNYAVEESKNK